MRNARRFMAAADNIHLDMDPWRFYGIPTSACSGPEEVTSSGETAYDWEGDFMKEHNVTAFGAAKRNPIKRIQVRRALNAVRCN